MPKKRIKKQEKTIGLKLSWTANAFVIIAVFFLVFFGLIAIFFNKELYESIKIAGITASFFLTLGIIWLILAFLIFTTNKSIRKTNDSAMKWFLLVLGLVTVLTGRLEGILIIIAFLIYIIHDKYGKTKK